MKPSLYLKLNLGIGDHIFCRSFIDPIRYNYEHIYITHATDALAFWFNNDPIRLKFNTQLGNLIFNTKPYQFVLNANYPFYPNDRIISLNKKPIKPNLDQLCAGKSLDIKNYIVITTKARQFSKVIFDQIKSKLIEPLNNLANKYTIIILGEKEVQRTKEYENSVNKGLVFGIYDFLIEVLPKDKIVDLTVPALGNTTSPFPQFQQDCLIMKEANAIITLGIGGNFWLASCLGQKVIGLRADNETSTDLIYDLPDIYLTKDVNQFIKYIETL
jgi:hypothetical protein